MHDRFFLPDRRTILGGTDNAKNRLDCHWSFVVYPQTLVKRGASILGEWHRLADMPGPRDWHTSTLVQRPDGRAMIAVIGGRRKPDSNEGSNQVWKYSMTRAKWEILCDSTVGSADASLPGPMFAHSAVFSPERNAIVVMGRGLSSIFDPAARAAPFEVWSFNLAGKSWEKLPSGPAGPPVRGMHQAVLVDGGRSVIVYGGVALDAAGKAPVFLGDMWRYSLGSGTWTQIECVNGPPGLAAPRLVDASQPGSQSKIGRAHV